METTYFLNALIAAGLKENAEELRKLPGWAKPSVARKYSASVGARALAQISPLNRSEKIALIKGLAMYEDSISGVGSVTHLQRLIGDLEEPVSDAFDWVVSNTCSYDYFAKGARSWAEYQAHREYDRVRKERNLEKERVRAELGKARKAEKATGNLLNAVRRGDTKAVAALIEKGASTILTMESGESLHDYAKKHGYDDIVEILDKLSSSDDPVNMSAPILIPTINDLYHHPRVRSAKSQVLQNLGYGPEGNNTQGAILDAEETLESRIRSRVGHVVSPRLLHEKSILLKSLKAAAEEVSDDLVNAYIATDYRVTHGEATIVLNVGMYSKEVEELLVQSNSNTAAFISAYNPDSNPLSDHENIKAHAALVQDIELAGYKYFLGEGKGQGSSWPSEPSILVVGIECGEAIALASKYRQQAFVWIRKQDAPRLILVGGSKSRDIHLQRFENN